jgi:hypothetical protein
LLLLLISISSCSDVSLGEYTTKSQQEAEIKRILIQYQDAKGRFDLERFLACLDDRGLYHFAGGMMVSKEKLKASLPAFWAKLQSDDPMLYPMGRESMNGDYLPSGRLVNPKIEINDGAAEVELTFTVGWWKTKHFISMVRLNGRWLINRLDWESG